MKHGIAIAAFAAAVCCGCANYSWKPAVPQDMRTVSVPTFRNESGVTGLGSAITTQTLREFQREGTYAIRPVGESAIEVQGIVRESDSRSVAYARKTGERNREHRLHATAIVSFIDKKSGRVLVDNRKYTATASFLAGDDILTGERDAAGRLAEDFARQIVDDALSLNVECDLRQAAGAAQETAPAPQTP